MTMRPRDVSDLHLAPVALRLDAELDTLSRLDEMMLDDRISFRVSTVPRTPEERRDALLKTVVAPFDMHGWEASWDARGLRISRGDHALVLGVPDNVKAYLGF